MPQTKTKSKGEQHKPGELPTTPSAHQNHKSNQELINQSELRTKLNSAVGQVVIALAQVPRYRHQSLADLQNVVLEPLMRDRIAIATSVDAGATAGTGGALVGIAFWATVSDEVDAKIREQIEGGGFPIRLKSEEWVSGPNSWLLDIVAPSQQHASAMLSTFMQMEIVKNGGEVRIHPVVTGQLDSELLKKLSAV
jgi:cytolysin-activating lysine-acyltransferase